MPLRTADAVVVGGGTVGAWCAYFLRQAGLDRVVLVEKGHLGQGAGHGGPGPLEGVSTFDGRLPQRLKRWR